MNDYEYLSTVERAYDYSSNPDDISIGTTIFWKSNDIKENSKPFFHHIKNGLDNNFKKVKYDIQPWFLYPGVGQGRIAPTKHYNNEKYFLSIDSHTDFVQGWDEQLIDLYENSRKIFGKRRVITTYLSSYKINEEVGEYFDGDKTIKSKRDVANRWQFFDFYKKLSHDLVNSTVFPFPNDKDMNKESIKIFENKIIDNEYLPAKKIAAHFYFTEADPWLTKYNINLDKDIKFWGEEFYQSALSYARGYNLVWIKTQLFFHLYDVVNSRKYEEKHEEGYTSFEEKLYFYNNYIKNSVDYNLNKINSCLSDDLINMKLIENKEKVFGYLPRSIQGFLSYSGINIVDKKTSPWWEVPNLNVVYK
jgi:hypothetical protein